MKILLVGKYGEGDIVVGPERFARELYSHLKNNSCDFEVRFVEYFFSDYKSSTIFKKLFGNEFIPKQSVKRLGIIPLISFLFKEKFEIIHIVNLQRFLLILFAFKPFLRSKITATLHGFMKFERTKKNFWRKRYFLDLLIEKLIILKCDLYIFPSTLLYNTYNKLYKTFDDKYKVIPNGVSELFYTEKNDYPPIKESVKIIFYNGIDSEIERESGYLLNLLEKLDYQIELFVLGNSINYQNQSRIKVVNVGYLNSNELKKFFADKHFIIKSKAFDSFSIMVLEGMVCGVIPIINTNIGISDFIKHEENGFLYNSQTPESLLNLIKDISMGKYDLKKISNEARKIYHTLNWKIIANKYIEIYKSIL